MCAYEYLNTITINRWWHWSIDRPYRGKRFSGTVWRWNEYYLTQREKTKYETNSEATNTDVTDEIRHMAASSLMFYSSGKTQSSQSIIINNKDEHEEGQASLCLHHLENHTVINNIPIKAVSWVFPDLMTKWRHTHWNKCIVYHIITITSHGYIVNKTV